MKCGTRSGPCPKISIGGRLRVKKLQVSKVSMCVLLILFFFCCFVLVPEPSVPNERYSILRFSGTKLGMRSEAREKENVATVPPAYVVTPTYQRLTQEADLLRMCYTLTHATHIHWILVEDREFRSALVIDLLARCQALATLNLTVTHLATFTNSTNTKRHKGVEQRNLGISWLLNHTVPADDAGGVYFADDDNTYDVRLFDAVRRTNGVSVWNVGLVGGSLVEGPVCSEGRVTGWQGAWRGNRTFPVDMASFALGVNFLHKHQDARFSCKSPSGHLESEFLQSFNITLTQLNPALVVNGNCSRVLVWHTKTRTPYLRH